MARATFVKKARKDVKGTNIKAGESYYWWKFRYGGKHCSKTRPRQSQLTQSEFLSTIYSIEEEIEDLSSAYDAKEAQDDIVQRLRDLSDECEERRSNMPDHLQDCGTGEMLQNRVDSVTEMADELENIDLSIVDNEPEESDFETEEEYNDEHSSWEDDCDNALSEFQSVLYSGE